MNIETSKLGTPAYFQPINLGPQPSPSAVDITAHASMTIIMILTTHRLDTQNTDSDPAAHIVATKSSIYISLSITREGLVLGPQIVTRAQPASGETCSNLLNKSREGISLSPSQHKHQSLSASVPETELRTAAGAFGPS
jgi:hypothetical protein